MAPGEWQPVPVAPTSFFVYVVFFLLLTFLDCFPAYASRSCSRPHFQVKLVRLALCFLLVCGLLNSVSANTFRHAPAVYAQEQLLALSQARLTPRERPEIPAELQRRRRGSREAMAVQTLLPSVITGHVRSLPNKSWRH